VSRSPAPVESIAQAVPSRTVGAGQERGDLSPDRSECVAIGILKVLGDAPTRRMSNGRIGGDGRGLARGEAAGV